MKWLKHLLPPLAGAILIAWLFRALGLNFADLRSGNLEAVMKSLQEGAEAGGAGRAVVLGLALAAFPFIGVPVTVLYLTLALALPPLPAMLAIVGGSMLNTLLAWLAGRHWGEALLARLGWSEAGMLSALRALGTRRPWIAVFLSRFVPVPFALTGVGLGLVGIPLPQAVFGTGFIMSFWAGVYVAFSEALRRGEGRLAMLAVGLLAALTLAAAVLRQSRGEKAGKPD